jgi:tRNA threonylcarbamoyl adenosine modification protein (Sua5/YciO/YrdC/YwlC family)
VDAARTRAIEEASAELERGRLVVLPTDTVYGLGAAARDPAAVRRLLAVKRRELTKPPPVLMADPADLADLAARVSPAAQALAQAFWPGVLSLVVEAASGLGWELGYRADGRQTLAVRVPAHEVARELLRAAGPLAVSSANVAGRPSALNAPDAAAQLGDAVALYLDAGPAPGGVESTVVDAIGPEVRILRVGACPVEAIAAAVAHLGIRVLAATGPGAAPARPIGRGQAGAA